MEAFVPNDIVKSKLGTKFLVLGLKSFVNHQDKLELIYDAFNMNLKSRATLHINSTIPDSFIRIDRNDLPDEEKNFAIIDARKMLLLLKN